MPLFWLRDDGDDEFESPSWFRTCFVGVICVLYMLFLLYAFFRNS